MNLWGADDAIGKPIRAYGAQYSIIGIMPETFDFPTGADIWTYRGETQTFEMFGRQYLGRLRSGVYLDKAAEELRTLEFKPGTGLFGNAGPAVQSLRTVLYGDRRPSKGRRPDRVDYQLRRAAWHNDCSGAYSGAAGDLRKSDGRHEKRVNCYNPLHMRLP